MSGKGLTRYLNVEIDVLKDIAKRTLLDNEPVWFGCDVGKMLRRDTGIWDAQLFDYASVYDTAFTLNKADRLVYRQTQMTHAMLFTGVDMVNGTARRWRVENSWGEENGQKGFYLMNDSWFDEYLFEIAARKSYLPAALRAALEEEPCAASLGSDGFTRVIPCSSPLRLRRQRGAHGALPRDCVGGGAQFNAPFPPGEG